MTGFAAGTLGRLALLSALTLTVSCQRKAVCDDVAGSCLALTVVGQGPFDELRTELALPGGAKKVGVTSGNIDLPLTLRVLPPDGVSSATISAVGVAGFVAGTSQASGSTGSDFSWPDGAHIAATVALQGASPVDAGVNDMSVVVDQGTLPDLTMPDLAGPPPTLRWTQESATGNPRQMLYGVFSGGSGQTFAVGESGIILARGATNWSSEASPTATDLHGVAGFAGNGTWTVGESPGAWRRAATWTADATGLVLQTGETVWSVAAGGTAGELWAGSENGKVWKRTSATGGNGAWTSEQALPIGNRVYGVAYAGGTVFAVGQRGWVGVRRGTAWTNYQYATEFPGTADALFGVSAINADAAVAVGSKGFAVRYSAGSWRSAVKINASDNEFNGVWMAPSGRSYAVGYNGLIVRLDQSLAATQLQTDSSQTLTAIFGLGETDIYVVGQRDRLPNPESLILHGTP